MPRPGPTSTAVPSTRSWRCAGTRSRPASWRRPAPPAASTSCSISTNEVFDGDAPRRPAATSRPTRSRPANPYGASKAAGRTARDGRLRGRAGRGARDRPDGLAVRVAGARLPEPDPRRRRARRRRPASRSAWSSRRVGDPDLHGGRRRRHRRARSPTTRPPASTTSSTACSRRGPTGRATSSAGPASTSSWWTCPPRPGPRPSRPPRWGVLAPTPLPSGEPMRPWPDAMADYAPALLRAARARA